VGNPSSVHAEGRKARHLLDDARDQVAALVGAQGRNVIFTSGGSEANVLALTPHIADGEDSRTRDRLLLSTIEHASVRSGGRFRPDQTQDIPVNARGVVDITALSDLLATLGGRKNGFLVSVMHANNETGVVQPILAIADMVHAAGAYFYCDGANFNAIVGRVRPGDLGVDAMHINLHKTFSTPHGGGGPGAGPVVFSALLAPHAPLPLMVKDDAGFKFIEEMADADDAGLTPFGRMCAFHGQMGMFVRALAYMFSHGSDGMRQASEDAVLNANYVRASLSDLMSLPFGDRPCMHEVLFDDHWLEGTGVTTLDFAKAMIDEGYHPMTVYFPLVVHGAMLIEPTESESKPSLDQFIASLRGLAGAAKAGDAARFRDAPLYAPRRRLDETKAAREPRLRWTPPDVRKEAAE